MGNTRDGKSVFVAFDLVEQFVRDVFVRAGVPEVDARIVADVLVQADKFGFDSHGVNRLKPIYLDRIREGIQQAVTRPEVVREGLATAVVDGHHGMGQVVAYQAMQLAVSKARSTGMGMVAVRNSTHYGFAGYYPLMAVKEDMIGITGTNARPSVAPTFGVENLLGTNPLTFAMPSDEAFPFMLDCATSIAQRGRIELYARENRALPEGWVVDDQGNAVTDARAALSALTSGRAALAPLGGIGEETAGYKGYGYATVVEILSAALQQGAFLRMLTGERDGRRAPFAVGHFFIAIDIAAFTDTAGFRKTTGDILRELRSSGKMPGQERIFTAGEKEYETWLQRRDLGIPFNASLLEEFRGLCEEYGLPGYLKYFTSTA
jgi:L-2-hydroxycarboxylate dehydrogenase (NAD+)